MQTQAAEKIQYETTKPIKITKKEIDEISFLSPLCRGCRNLQNHKCKKGMIPAPKFLGGEKCKRFHIKNK